MIYHLSPIEAEGGESPRVGHIDRILMVVKNLEKNCYVLGLEKLNFNSRGTNKSNPLSLQTSYYTLDNAFLFEAFRL